MAEWLFKLSQTRAIAGVIEEFAVLRRHQYHIVVMDLNERRTHEVLEGRSMETIRDFMQMSHYNFCTRA